MEARLVAPPRGRAGLGALLAGGARAASAARGAVPGLWAAALLRGAGEAAPLAVFVGVLRRRIAEGADPLAAALGTLGDRAFVLPGFGLLAAAWLAGWAVELFVWSGAGRVVASALQTGRRPPPGTFARGVAHAFGRVAALGVLWALILAAFVAMGLPPLLAGARLWAESLEAGAGGLPASAGLALPLALLLCFPLLLLVARLSLARAIAFGDRAAPAVYEGARLALRRPSAALGLWLLAGLAAAAIETSIAGPAVFLPPSGWGLALRWALQATGAFGLAVVSLVRMAAFVALASDDLAAGR